MSEKKWFNTAVESMDVISNRLIELSNLMDTVYSSLLSESIEKQALDCIMCFLYAVNKLHIYTGQAMKELGLKPNTYYSFVSKGNRQ